LSAPPKRTDSFVATTISLVPRENPWFDGFDDICIIWVVKGLTVVHSGPKLDGDCGGVELCGAGPDILKTCMLSGETNGDQAKVHPSIAVAKASDVPKSN
jgi:hypothetical protein